MRRLFLLFAVLAAGLIACSSAESAATTPADSTDAGPGPTVDGGAPDAVTDVVPAGTATIFVGIDSEPLANSGYNLTALRMTASVDGKEIANQTWDAKAGPLFPREVRLDAPKGKPDANVEVLVAGVMGEGGDIVTRLVKTRFVSDRVKLLHVFLQTRCVEFALLGGFAEPAPHCVAPETCVAGKCVSSDVDPAKLPEYYADWQSNPPSVCGDGTAPAIDTSVTEGGTVTLERGGQCGHHLYVDFVGMKDLSQFKTITSIAAVMPNSSVTIPTTSVPYTWAQASNGTCELPHVRFQVDSPGHKVEEYLGQDMTMTITATDDKQRTVTITRHVKVAATFNNPTGRPCN